MTESEINDIVTGNWTPGQIAAFEQAHPVIIWLYCPKTGCDNRPFKVTDTELSEAEGVIYCEVCGGECVEYVSEAEKLRRLNAPTLPGL